MNTGNMRSTLIVSKNGDIHGISVGFVNSWSFSMVSSAVAAIFTTA